MTDPSNPGMLAVTGASGKTGWRVVQEALGRGYRVRAIVRPSSLVPAGLEGAELIRLELGDQPALERALQGVEVLVIATGARPSIDLSGPLQVDALAMRSQIDACRAAGVGRVVLVSSLCSGRLFHPLNLFGLILLWKRLGERWLQESGLAWTVVRPGGLKETEQNLEAEGIRFSGPDQQESNSIPRRLVARVCLDALQVPAASGRIIEITSGPDVAPIGLAEWLQGQPQAAAHA
ncbi:SDR family oxidoreductase [Synechococcus sp. Tobar12-5m-g]|uniref:SDR family oxidoreductase n=1 Tax=unclassified Synechococcus TaxID=2626047 RepID=UPI0020CDD47A|nr:MULTISPECIES: SDR family oxidoreductase [unclassified Synechococcus]MCP9773130.1 SDR family oxidoreductase [Synechococcus sp. Tobar12-5m-g]MCP9874036.1 SDR family oxidoreductase [Synechococcus sp. Cruz CV-v-12]